MAQLRVSGLVQGKVGRWHPCISACLLFSTHCTDMCINLMMLLLIQFSRYSRMQWHKLVNRVSSSSIATCLFPFCKTIFIPCLQLEHTLYWKGFCILFSFSSNFSISWNAENILTNFLGPWPMAFKTCIGFSLLKEYWCKTSSPHWRSWFFHTLSISFKGRLASLLLCKVVQCTLAVNDGWQRSWCLHNYWQDVRQTGKNIIFCTCACRNLNKKQNYNLTLLSG